MQIVTSYNNVYVISVNTYKGSQNDNIFLKIQNPHYFKTINASGTIKDIWEQS